MDDKRALVIGIDRYGNRRASLSCCVNDAEHVAKELRGDGFGFEVSVLLNDEATRPAILRWITEVRNDRPTTTLVYFAGHGVRTELGSFLVTSDHQEFDEGIDLSTLVRLLAGADEADHNTLIMLDCCHAGAALAPRGMDDSTGEWLTPQDVRSVFHGHGVATIAACMAQQRAWEEYNHGHGVFTYYLLGALRGEAADHQGFVTAHTIYETIARNMSTGPQATDQRPVFAGHVTGRLVVGEGLPPFLPEPPSSEVSLRTAARALELLDSYATFKSRFNTITWRSEGHEGACGRLEVINAWFEEKRSTMAGRPDFAACEETLLRYRTELGLAEGGTVMAEGTLLKRLGSGGFGTVWQVVDEKSESLAFKIYHPNEMSNGAKIARFKNGYDAMRLLRHPNIVRVSRYSTCPIGIVMEYIEGENLRELEMHSHLSFLEIIELLIKMAEAVRHAHSNDVIHRDIKPENIVCRMDEHGVLQPYLTDFDLAWFNTNTDRATKSALGVVYYAAPEQHFAFDAKAVSSKSPTLDVFSFGQLLYFCVTGRDPSPVLQSENIRALETATKAAESNALTRRLSLLYSRATAWKPSDRMQSFEEILRLLREARSELAYTDPQETIHESEFAGELIHHLTGEPHDPTTQPTIDSRTGNWKIAIKWLDLRQGKKVYNRLTVHFTPNHKISMENTSNSQMRIALNRRLDEVLKPFDKIATRRSGQKGAFEVSVEFKVALLTRSAVLDIGEAISVTLTALERMTIPDRR